MTKEKREALMKKTFTRRFDIDWDDTMPRACMGSNSTLQADWELAWQAATQSPAEQYEVTIAQLRESLEESDLHIRIFDGDGFYARPIMLKNREALSSTNTPTLDDRDVALLTKVNAMIEDIDDGDQPAYRHCQEEISGMILAIRKGEKKP